MSQGNIYYTPTEDVRALFGDYLDGADNGAMLVISERVLDGASRNAVSKSMERFGYGTETCTFATLSPRESQDEGGDVDLDAQALFMLVEGLDPLCVICADGVSANRLGKAYRMTYELDAPIRVFGRSGVAFRNLQEMMNTERGRQHAWHLLKSLPKR